MFQISKNIQYIILLRNESIYLNLSFLNSLRVFFLCFFALFSSMAFSNTDWHIAVDGIVTKDDQRLKGAIVTLVNMEKYPEVTRSIVTPGNGKFIFILEPENDYLIIASKTGLVTKKIMFSTKNVPEDRVGKGFTHYPIEIVLFEEVEGLNTSLLKEPLGKIVYNYKINDFEVDKEYAKSIRVQVLMLQKALQATKKRVEIDKKIEMKRLVKSKKAEEREFARNGRRGIKELEKIVNEMAVMERSSIEKSVKETIARKVIEENAYKITVVTETAGQANDEKNEALSTIPREMEKATSNASPAGRKRWPPVKVVFNLKSEHKPTYKRAILISAMGTHGVAKGAGYRSLLATEYPEGVTEESFIEGKKNIIRRIVVLGGHAIEYKKIAHSWGSIFYFKNGKSISKYVFDLETDMDIVESKMLHLTPRLPGGRGGHR